MIEWQEKPLKRPDEEPEGEDRDGGELTLIDREYFYDLLMEQQEQM